jgi:hypothetical protein
MADIYCARCGRLGHSETALLENWEHDLRTPEEAVSRAVVGDTIGWVCPDCLTDSERAAIDQEIAEFAAEEMAEEMAEEIDPNATRADLLKDALKSMDTALWHLTVARLLSKQSDDAERAIELAEELKSTLERALAEAEEQEAAGGDDA